MYMLNVDGPVCTMQAFWTYDVRYPDASAGPYTAEIVATESVLDQASIRRELHAVGPDMTSSISSDGIVAWAAFNATQDFVKSSIASIIELLEKGVPTLIYTGQFDNCMNPLSTANWMAKVAGWRYPRDAPSAESGAGAGGETHPDGRNYSMSSLLALPRVPFKRGGVTVGLSRSLGGLTNAIVLRSGHMTTLEQANVTKQLYLDFISGSLPGAGREPVQTLPA